MSVRKGKPMPKRRRPGRARRGLKREVWSVCGLAGRIAQPGWPFGFGRFPDLWGDLRQFALLGGV